MKNWETLLSEVGGDYQIGIGKVCAALAEYRTMFGDEDAIDRFLFQLAPHAIESDLSIGFARQRDATKATVRSQTIDCVLSLVAYLRLEVEEVPEQLAFTLLDLERWIQDLAFVACTEEISSVEEVDVRNTSVLGG